jgi:hypothetical protein
VIASMLLSGCLTPPGMNFFKPMSFTNADGTTSAKAVKIASFAVDFVGLKTFSINVETGDVNIAFFDTMLTHEQYAVLNAKGEVVGTLTRAVVPGIYTARVIEAYGEAGKKIVDAVSAGITGAFLSSLGPVALGKGMSAIPLAFKP